MSRSTYTDRVHVVANLRSRDLHDRADWVDRSLPPFIDLAKNAGLLRTLGIDVADLPRVEACGAPAAG